MQGLQLDSEFELVLTQ